MDAPAGWLVVTDSITIASSLSDALTELGARAEVTPPGELTEALAKRDVAGVLLDAAIAEPLARLAEVTAAMPDRPCLLLAPPEHLDLAQQAARSEGADYVRTPVAIEELRRALDGARHRTASSLDKPPPSLLPADACILGESVAIQKLLSKLRRAARGTSTVLIQGESGTGKELIARQLHHRSPRQGAPFIKVHCGALPDNLLESELFGYERGAFTGAEARKPGRVELAEGGTLFLDEIGDISSSFQVKLLRVLQDRAYERLGGTKTLRADVRFVSATHRDLRKMVADGEFREDLYYRLNVVRLVAPPLRSRSDDVPVLARRFAEQAAEANGVPPVQLEPDALGALQRYSWPGNVRQLQHIVERLVVMAEQATLGAAEVEDELQSEARGQSTDSSGDAASGPTEAGTSGPSVVELATALRAAEREALDKAIRKAGTDRSLAARLLGVSRRKLFYMLKQHGIT